MTVFFDITSTGLSTTDPRIAERHEAAGLEVIRRTAALTTLAEICQAHAPAAIHFLKVDLCERNGNWEVGELSRPFGRGVNFQMMVSALAPILDDLEAANWPLFRGPEEAWYRTGNREGGQKEFLVQDPDGYLLRFAQDIGGRATA